MKSWTAEGEEVNSLDKWHEGMVKKYGAYVKPMSAAEGIEDPNTANAVERANHIAASKERGKLISHKENSTPPFINFSRNKCFALMKTIGEKTNEIITYQIDGDEASISRMVWHTEDNDFNEAHSVHEVRPELSRNHWKNRVKQGYRVFAQDLWPYWLFRYFDNEEDR